MKDILVIPSIALICVLFFLHLFYPAQKLLATPDFGQSDIWSLNLPAKQFLSDSLRRGEWPLWNPYVANGYPQLAEGQIGTFYIPNLLLFRFLPFITAYNIGYVLTFFIAACGMYVFVRSLKFSPILSLFASLIFAFSAYFLTHMSHYNLLQTSALFPWIFYALHKGINTRKNIYLIFFAFLLSQQIFTGFPQIVLITLIAGIFFSLYMLLPQIKKNIKILCLIGVFVIVGFFMAAIQLLPQSQFLKSSTRGAGLPGNLSTYYSFPFSHLLTMLNPTILGTPKDGSYQMTRGAQGIIFWENSGFIGSIPFLLAITAIFFLKKNRYVQCFCLLAVLCLLFMTGKYSPFYFLYSFPPLTFFRVPSRFILPFLFSCIILSIYVLKYIQNRYTWGKMATMFIMTFSLYQVFHFAVSYNPTVPAETVLSTPEVKKFIKNTDDKIISIGSALYWNEYFYSKGWKNPKAYLPYKNALTANQNVLYGVKSVDVYRSQITRRFDIVMSLLMSMDFDQKQASPTASMINTANLYGVDYLISTIDVKENIGLLKQEDLETDPVFGLYKFENSRPDEYLTTTLIKTKTVNAVKEYMEMPLDHVREKPVFINQEISLLSKQNPQGEIHKINNTNSAQKYQVKTETEALLVINQSYDENWHAKISGAEKTIHPININQLGILVPKGVWIVELDYYPQGWLIAKLVSYVLPVFLSIFVFLQFVKRDRSISK